MITQLEEYSLRHSQDKHNRILGTAEREITHLILDELLYLYFSVLQFTNL